MAAIENTSDILPGVSQAIGTDYRGVGGDASLVTSVHLKWDAVYVGTIYVDSSNFPDVALNSTTAGDWINETASGITTTVAGGTASGAMIHLGNLGNKRLRLRIVTTTAGALRARSHGKV
jgi:hypothetical protein